MGEKSVTQICLYEKRSHNIFNVTSTHSSNGAYGMISHQTKKQIYYTVRKPAVDFPDSLQKTYKVEPFFFSPLQSWISMFGAFWQLMQRKTAVTMYFRMFHFNTSFLLENNLVCVVYLNKLNKYNVFFVIRSSSCNQSKANDQDKCLGII